MALTSDIVLCPVVTDVLSQLKVTNWQILIEHRLTSYSQREFSLGMQVFLRTGF